jgi:uncharacterized protein YlxW (UPF0749 family)
LDGNERSKMKGRIVVKKIKISLAIGILCTLLALGVAVQVRTVTESSTTVAQTQAENELRDSVLKWKTNYDNANTKLEYKEAELETLRNQITSSDESSEDVKTELETNNQLLGYTDLTGSGVVITAADGDSSNVKGLSSLYIVHDGDLVGLVNALKNAGAEAISINGQRIVNTTAITCAGNIVLINGEKVGSPFIINAIGNPERLYGQMIMPDSYYDNMKSDGVDMKIVKENSISVPKYTGLFKFSYARVVD